MTDSDEGYVPQGTRVHGKRALAELLEAWRRDSQAPTIGDVGSFGQKAWVHVEVGGYEVALNADTTRAAVEAFLDASRPDPDQPWQVIANRNGRINKVVPYPEPEPLPGWYAYLKSPLAAAGRI